jgi:predicted nucleic acid-binding protein
MPFVLDASTTACWAFPDEQDSRADLAFLRMHTDEAIVPALWWFEVRNLLAVNERRKRITEADTTQFLERLSHLPIHADRIPAESEVMRLARQHRLSIYLSAYLELAHRHRLPLATLDKALTNAARAENVRLLA